MGQSIKVSADSILDFDARGRSQSFPLPPGDYSKKPGEIHAVIDGKSETRKGVLSRVSGKASKWVLKKSI